MYCFIILVHVWNHFYFVNNSVFYLTQGFSTIPSFCSDDLCELESQTARQRSPATILVSKSLLGCSFSSKSLKSGKSLRQTLEIRPQTLEARISRCSRVGRLFFSVTNPSLSLTVGSLIARTSQHSITSHCSSGLSQEMLYRIHNKLILFRITIAV